MKKIIAMILVLTLALSLVACGGKKNDEVKEPANDVVEETIKNDDVVEDDKAEVKEEKEENKKDNKKEETVKPSEQKPAEKPAQTPAEQPTSKPAETTPVKPETPAEKPVSKPAEKPAEKPADPAPTTLGTTLLADFKTKAASGMGVEEIANALLENPAIKFMGGAMPVEEGLLSGFDNAEIKGFKSGAVFMPMIGSIAFVGYVFELANASDASAFIANLKANANPRWNICVEAEETVTGSYGNKVFFVMCPTSLEE